MTSYTNETRGGMAGWRCTGGGCGFWADNMMAMKGHWASGAHSKPDQAKQAVEEMAGMLDALRRRAFAEGRLSMLDEVKAQLALRQERGDRSISTQQMIAWADGRTKELE